MTANPPRLVVAGLGSGSGKTSLCVGLVRAFRRLGLEVATFKTGPDYLDPTYLTRASGRTCHNLDPWMLGPEACVAEVAIAGRTADLVIVEGVMGLFDGARPDSDVGSTAELARLLNAPVLLCVDASGMARTLASLVHGVRGFAPDLRLAGVVANRVGSQRHAELLGCALEGLSPAAPFFGGLPKEAAPAFASRHLGLNSARNSEPPESTLDAWGEAVTATLDMRAILAAARAAEPLPSVTEAGPRQQTSPASRCRVAVAEDDAFHFYYPHNLRTLEAAGAELVRFSPLRDTRLPEADAVWIGGGYPELHAAVLSKNRSMHEALRAHARANKPLYAECGGLMYLSDFIVDLQGETHTMVGCVRGRAVLYPRLKALGYVEVQTLQAGILGPPGTRLRGHQFRYSDLLQGDAPCRYRATRRRDGHVFECGHGGANVWASYAHLTFTPAVAEHFVAACQALAQLPQTVSADMERTHPAYLPRIP